MLNFAKVFFALGFCFFSTASLGATRTEQGVCRLTGLYMNHGWVIHNPADFKSIEKTVTQRIQTGLESGTIIVDTSGMIGTDSTVEGNAIALMGYMFDDLTTSQDTMYGDLALIEWPERNNVRAEIRWFDGKNRNIVFNPDILTCFTESPPFVDNSVL